MLVGMSAPVEMMSVMSKTCWFSTEAPSICLPIP